MSHSLTANSPSPATIELIKTSRGFVPFKKAFLNKERDTISFELGLDQNVMLDANSPFESSKPGFLLFDLATCVEHANGSMRVVSERILEIAKRFGPLFGESDTEPIIDWAAACLNADIAIMLQQIANGQRGESVAPVLADLEKSVFTNLETKEQITFYDIWRGLSASYVGRLKPGCHVRRMTIGSRHIYAFVVFNIESDETEAGMGYAELAAISLEHEMTPQDYEMIRKQFSGSIDEGVLRDQVWRYAQTGSEPDEPKRRISGKAEYGSRRERLDSDDASALGLIVKTLINAHLAKGAHVDPFQEDEATGYITFDNLLSWIWFDFSKCLDAAKIGYCANCGKPFSLVGHRGISRSYCSQTCKTKAKNAYSKRMRDEARTQFLEEGLTIAEIVERSEEKAKAAGEYRRGLSAEAVKELLCSWPELKNQLECQIETKGREAPLLHRCNKELGQKGVMHLLSARAEKLLRRELKDGAAASK